MAKTKEQCIHIINKKFSETQEGKDVKTLFLLLEEIVRDISGAEYSQILIVDKENNCVENVTKEESLSFSLEPSIVESVFLSKKGLFDNHVVSRKEYNPKLDNPLNLELKALLVTPIIDKSSNEVVAFISAYNSTSHNALFQRYDIRMLGLLNRLVISTIKKLKEPSVIPLFPEKNKVISSEKELVIQEYSSDSREKILEKKLQEQAEKIKALESQLFLKGELLKNQQKENLMALDVVEENTISVEEDKEESSKLHTILEFLTNEVTYLANEEYKLYLFLEIIKNSLHNKEQLNFLNQELDNTQLIENLANSLYNREKMPLLEEPFNLYQLINDVANLYGENLSYNNITFNIFINPKIPSLLISDMYKIKSLIIHLMNNVFFFTSTSGAIELNVDFSEITKLLSIEIKGIKESEEKQIKSLFFSHVVSHSLSSSDNGLGLSVSSNLIHIMGGKLKLSTVGSNEHSLMALIPIGGTDEHVDKKKSLVPKKSLKVVILRNRENRYALLNLLKQLMSIGVDETSITVIENGKNLHNLKVSHLFCFENLFSFKLPLSSIPSVTILKYSKREVQEKMIFNEIYLNSYYGLELQRIFFPDRKLPKIVKNTLLVEDSFLSKFNNVVKKLKLS
jgi:signal transduction histidine kinase